MKPLGFGVLPRPPDPEANANLMTVFKNGNELRTLADWKEHGHPKSEKHWQEGRSAMEAARFWLSARSPALPGSVDKLVQNHPSFGSVAQWSGEPEARMPFDSFAGEPRNADLLVTARDSNGEYLIAVEAKADETFGDTVGEELAAAVERKLENTRSNGVPRIEQLVESILSPRRKGEPTLANLRYQLFTATAGALSMSASKQHTRVLLLVQEFVTPRTKPDRQKVNSRDLRDFLRRLSHGEVREVKNGEIMGPFQVPGKPMLTGASTVPDLYIAKIQCDVPGSP